MNRPVERYKEHGAALLLVSGLLIAWAVYLAPDSRPARSAPPFAHALEIINPNEPLNRALLQDMLDWYRPDQPEQNEAVLSALQTFRKQQLRQLRPDHVAQIPFRAKEFRRLLAMFLNFILLYLLALGLTYYGVQTLAVYLFIRKQRHIPPFLIQIKNAAHALGHTTARTRRLRHARELASVLGAGLMRALAQALLFTPAYVTAYSIKSDFNTDSVLFLILLAVVSNGLLIQYANKFFTLLISESRKGYVLTARVKNLNHAYEPQAEGGISLRQILALRKSFPGHVFGHIFMNARFQYIETLKEQAAFLISSLIIIEMALNIHGHFSYELLQQLLYKNYHYALLMALGYFILVKATDMLAEALKQHEKNKLGEA